MPPGPLLGGHSSLKVDFKREIVSKGDEFGELLIDLCSIANTDDPEHYGDAGYLIIGFTRDGTHHALPQDFDADKLSASLHNTIANYLSPIIAFTVAGPYVHPKGQYAVIRIPPSQEQPHMVIRESGPAKTGVWWVRRGDTKALAGPQDYVRVLRKAVARETRPLQDRVASTQALLDNLEARLERLQTSAVQHSGMNVADSPDLTVAAKIRGRYQAEDMALRQALHREVLTFLESFDALFPDSSVERAASNREHWRALAVQLEALTRPLGTALAAAILHAGGELDDAVIASLQMVARRTLTYPAYNSLTGRVEHLRAYPHTLLLFTMWAASLQARRTTWLRELASEPVNAFLNPAHLLDHTRTLIDLNEEFAPITSYRSCAPAYQHLREVVTGLGGWVSGGDPFADPVELGLETELLQSVSLLDAQPGVSLFASAIPNTLVYHVEADKLIARFLARDADLFQAAVSGNLLDLLRQYVQQVQTYNAGMCRPRITSQALAPLQT